MREHEILPEPTWEQQALDTCFQHAYSLQEALNQCENFEQASSLAYEHIPVLNDLFPYLHHQVLISGEGVMPLIDENNMMEAEAWLKDQQANGIHVGFGLIDIDRRPDNYDFRLMQRILIGQSHNQPFASVEIRQWVYKHFDLHSQIIPNVELESVLSSSEYKTVFDVHPLQAAFKYSEEFVKLVRSTTFRRLNRGQQRRVADDLIYQANQRAVLRDFGVSADLEYGYIAIREKNTTSYLPLNLEKVVISGKCLGLESLESQNLGVDAIRRDKDLLAKDAGLCMVIEPDNSTRQGLNLELGQLMYLPLHNQEIEVELYSQAEAT
jgi:hypothetical protein